MRYKNAVKVINNGSGKKILRIEGHPAGTAEWGDWTGARGWAYRPANHYNFLIMPNALDAISELLKTLDETEPNPYGIDLNRRTPPTN